MGYKRPTLDHWIGRKIGLAPGALPTRSDIEDHQLTALNKTLALAFTRSRFYRERFGSIVLTNLSDMAELPFTSPEDLRKEPLRMLCASPGEISRIVTLTTSGTSGGAKRVYFTKEDQELCIDFFHYGMQNLVDKTDIVGVLFPASRPGSVGDLLQTGLGRIGAKSFALFENAAELSALTEFLESEAVSSLAGPPSLLESLAEFCLSSPSRPALKIKSVLLSADFVSDECRSKIKKAWDAEIFEHYGMTEMGLGCAVSCEAQLNDLDNLGYHVREADIYIEIIDPDTGMPVSDGEPGEIVFTTLTRKGMPFIRYRTGDISRWIPGACSCGTVLKLLGRVGDRGLKKGGDLNGKLF